MIKEFLNQDLTKVREANIASKKNKSGTVLEVKDLVVQYLTREGIVEAVNGVSFSIDAGEVMGLVGETGAGKTTTALSCIGLLPDKVGHIANGSILLNGREIVGMSEKKLEKIRGKEVSMIFQDPMTALNPSMFVGDQIAEVIKIHDGCGKAQAKIKAMEMLAMVGIRPERYNDYPHQFSGGMKQRVVIAIALACNPELLIADEPTTALDVTIQAQILEIMKDLSNKLGTAVMMITHDLGVVAEICSKCAVMYAGELVEMGTVEHIFENPQHPYTIGLFESIPNLEEEIERLKPIPGLMADPMMLSACCNFADRCSYSCEECKAGLPPYEEVEPGHFVRCFHPVKSGLAESGDSAENAGEDR